MTTKRTAAQILDSLFTHLGDDRWELGELIADVTEGADVVNPFTNRLIKELLEAMRAPGAMGVEDIYRDLQQIGTEFANSVAEDFRDSLNF